MNEPLAQRLRPKTLDDYVGQEKAKGICWPRGGCSAAPSRADAFPT